ncbi:MAG: DnaJ domain-containing protein [Flavobacteriales bacterium]|jgi:DnaJ like chaperone protein|tara:strand:+ start:325 stop:1179 length:855 start_codon:yes stop_codon:yes gene_type:complete
MEGKLNLKAVWVFLKKNNIITFLIFFLPLVIYFAPLKFRFNGPNSVPESSILLVSIVAMFPALILMSIVSFFRQNNSTYWLKPLVEIIVLAARVDGEITAKDRKVMFNSFKSELGSSKIKKALSYFDSIAKEPNLDLDLACAKLLKVFDNSNSVILLNVIVKVTLTDQYLSAKEEIFLNSVCRKLGLPKSNLTSILARRVYVSENKREQQSRQTFKPKHSSLSRSYKVLGLSENASFEEVKKAYRSLAKQYHPDKIRDKDLKENAKRQFQEITEAYNQIKDRKG